jgi:hypothetical protein
MGMMDSGTALPAVINKRSAVKTRISPVYNLLPACILTQTTRDGEQNLASIMTGHRLWLLLLSWLTVDTPATGFIHDTLLYLAISKNS